MSVAYIALGSNLDRPLFQVKAGINRLALEPQITLLAQSAYYQNPPMGKMPQADYVNAVVKIETSYSPHELLAVLQKIEALQGRVRTGQRWESRILDLDLLLFDHFSYCDEKLTLPHPGLTLRDFVIYPLLEIDENLKLPDGRALKDIAKTLTNHLQCVCPS